MPTYLTPGVYYEITDSAAQGITAIRTDIAAFIGLAERGPLHQPVALGSWEQFQQIFGNFLATAYLAYSVKAFFDNGGLKCYVVRVAAQTAALASALVLDEHNMPTLQIEASSPGSWGEQLALRAGRSHSAATQSRNAIQPSDGSASLVEQVGGFEPGTLVKIYQNGLSAPVYRVVMERNLVDRRLRWHKPVAPPDFDLTNPLGNPLFFETLEFSLSVYQGRLLQEIFSGLSLVAEHPRYIGKAINSRFIKVTNLRLPPLSLHSANLLELDTLPGSLPTIPAGLLKLANGKDGLLALSPADFTGNPAIELKTGLRTLEDVNEIALVALPDLMIQPGRSVSFSPLPEPPHEECLPGTAVLADAAAPALPEPEQPPGFSLEEIYRVQQRLLEHCEAQHDRLALLDPPLRGRGGSVLNIAEIQTWRQRFDSSFAALYYPWLLVYDPLRAGTRLIPPGGHVAGVFARLDITLGVHYPPANVELRWAQALSQEISAEVQGLLNPAQINCLRTFAGRGLRLYGARTLSSDPNWRFINVRRLLLMIEKALAYSLQWAVFEPDDFYLRQTLTLTISSFLRTMWERGALVGNAAEEAFFVRCDETNNPAALTDQGQLMVEIGVAPVKPAEFVIFQIGRVRDVLQISEQGGDFSNV